MNTFYKGLFSLGTNRFNFVELFYLWKWSKQLKTEKHQNKSDYWYDLTYLWFTQKNDIGHGFILVKNNNQSTKYIDHCKSGIYLFNCFSHVFWVGSVTWRIIGGACRWSDLKITDYSLYTVEVVGIRQVARILVTCRCSGDIP